MLVPLEFALGMQAREDADGIVCVGNGRDFLVQLRGRSPSAGPITRQLHVRHQGNVHADSIM